MFTNSNLNKKQKNNNKLKLIYLENKAVNKIKLKNNNNKMKMMKKFIKEYYIMQKTKVFLENQKTLKI